MTSTTSKESIILNRRQKLRRWFRFPFDQSVAIRLCDENRELIKSLPTINQEQFWDKLMKNESFDIILKYELQKHKEHFVSESIT